MGIKFCGKQQTYQWFWFSVQSRVSGNWIISMGVKANPGQSNDRKKGDKLHLEEVYMKLLNESSREKEWGGFINVLHKHIGNVTSLDVPKDPFLKALRSYDQMKQLHSWKGNRINEEWRVHERQSMTWFQLHFFFVKYIQYLHML